MNALQKQRLYAKVALVSCDAKMVERYGGTDGGGVEGQAWARGYLEQALRTIAAGRFPPPPFNCCGGAFAGLSPVEYERHLDVVHRSEIR